MTTLPDKFAAVLILLLSLHAGLARSDEADRALAAALSAETNHEFAAVEWRRLALRSGAGESSGYSWAAAYEYFRANRHDAAVRMLDRAEESSTNLTAAALLLRADSALERKDFQGADYYLEALSGCPAAADWKNYSSLRAAESRLRQGRFDEARTALDAYSPRDERRLAAVEGYVKGHDKSPELGGLLGAVLPGLGYAYSGEYGNATRSFVLNGIFIFGMARTARDESWGAFAGLSFFELAWYTGSIYGGVDAAYRFNQNRLENAVEDIRGNARFTPDFNAIPVVSLRFTF